MKLRKWVKITLLTIVVALLITWGNNHYEKAINDCVEAGNDIKMCEGGLR